jgi:predicted transcriptional regulator
VYAVRRTTIFTDEKVLREIESIARRGQRSLSATIRAALDEFVQRHRRSAGTPSFVALGRSGRSDVAERSEELLWTKRGRRHR